MSSNANFSASSPRSMERLIASSNDIIAALMPAIVACSGMDDLEEEVPKLIQEIRQALGRIQELEEEHRTATSEYTELKSQLGRAESDMSKTTEELGKHKKAIEALQSQLELSEGKVQHTQRKHTELKGHLNSLRQEIDREQQAKRDIIAEKQVVGNEILLEKLKANMDNEKTQNKTLLSLSQQLEATRSQLEQTKAALLASQTSLADQSSTHQEEIIQKEAEIFGTEQELDHERAQNKTMSQRLKSVRGELGETKSLLLIARRSLRDQNSAHQAEIIGKDMVIAGLKQDLEMERAGNQTESLEAKSRNLSLQLEQAKSALSNAEKMQREQSANHENELAKNEAAMHSLQQELDTERAGNESSLLRSNLERTLQLLQDEKSSNRTDHLTRQCQQLKKTLIAEREAVADLTAELHNRTMNDPNLVLQDEVRVLQNALADAMLQNKELRDRLDKAPKTVQQTRPRVGGESHKSRLLSTTGALPRKTSIGFHDIEDPSGDSSNEEPPRRKRRVGSRSPQKAVSSAVPRVTGLRKTITPVTDIREERGRYGCF